MLEFLFCADLCVKLRRAPKQLYRETPEYVSMLYFDDGLWDWVEAKKMAVTKVFLGSG